MLAGFVRTVLTVVLVWVVYRWLDATFGNRGDGPRGGGGGGGGGGAPRQPEAGRGRRQPDDNRVGDYIEYEEV
jgi:hypothetical protein